MKKLLSILWSSLRMAMQELRVNKLRTFLSLFGITIGIFCIISVLATVNSLEHKVQTDLDKLGSNSIYIDKWEYSGGGEDYPWWKYINRPFPKIEEMYFIQSMTNLYKNIAFVNTIRTKINYESNQFSGVNLIGATDGFFKIQSLAIEYGRGISDNEYQYGSPVGVMGNELATNIFSDPALAVDKEINCDGRRIKIVGVLTKEGQNFANAFEFDKSVLTAHQFFSSIYAENNSDPFIMVQAKDNVSTAALQDELRSIMKRIRKISPLGEDNFSLNDIKIFTEQTASFFGAVSLAGWAIAGLSLIVGGFGIANIMFVSVKERIAQIGLKKSLGAPSSLILMEFLLESILLCILGGLIGLGLVWILTKALGVFLPFTIFIAPHIIVLALSVCIFIGITAGIIPASVAAKMNPVKAIRSN